MDGSGVSGGEGCLVSLRDEDARFFLPSRCVLSDKQKPALQFGSEISRFGSDLSGLPSGFASKPAIQFLRQCVHPQTLGGWLASWILPSVGLRTKG
jgi:hypothetical protein